MSRIDPTGEIAIPVIVYYGAAALVGAVIANNTARGGSKGKSSDDPFGGATGASSSSGATSKTTEQCPPDTPCDPPVGTQCWSMDVDSTPHRTIDYLGTKLGKRDTHVHIYEMQRVGTNCWWKKLGGYALDYAPSPMSPCTSYASWVNQPIH